MQRVLADLIIAPGTQSPSPSPSPRVTRDLTASSHASSNPPAAARAYKPVDRLNATAPAPEESQTGSLDYGVSVAETPAGKVRPSKRLKKAEPEAAELPSLHRSKDGRVPQVRFMLPAPLVGCRRKAETDD